MNKRILCIVSALVAAWAGTTSVSYAQSGPLFSEFPQACATSAQEQLSFNSNRSASSPQINISFDGEWMSKVTHVSSLYGDLMYPSTVLLRLAEENTTAPRVSNSQARQARKIVRKYERDALYRIPLLNNVDSMPIPADFDRYQCLTDTCPSGVACTILALRKEGEEFRGHLSRFRLLHNEAMNWASKVRHLKRKVPHLTRNFDKVENRLIAALDDLPTQIFVIDAYVPRK